MVQLAKEQLLAIGLLLGGIAVASGSITIFGPVCLGTTILGVCVGLPLNLNLFLGLGFLGFGFAAWWHAYRRTGKLIG